MRLHRIRRFHEWRTHSSRIGNEFRAGAEMEHEISLQLRTAIAGSRADNATIEVPGWSYTAAQYVGFRLDARYGRAESPNWRERLVCPVTGLSNRIRASVHLFELEGEPYRDSVVYLTEQVTPLYTFLKGRYPNVMGSEYLGAEVERGSHDHRGIRHEDLTALSLEDGSVDYVLSFDCMEHVPDYRRALREISRVLRENGRLIWSAPFDLTNPTNIQRASVDADGTVIHHMPPEYHGNPVSAEGSLCFTTFGWEVLDECVAAGFRDAYVVLYWSRSFGYLGGDQVMMVARK